MTDVLQTLGAVLLAAVAVGLGVTDKGILLGDPATGLRTVPPDEFARMWRFTGITLALREPAQASVPAPLAEALPGRVRPDQRDKAQATLAAFRQRVATEDAR